MRFRSLAIEEKASQTFTHLLSFAFGDIPAGIAVNTALVLNTVALGMPAIPAGTIIKRVLLHLTTAFKDASDAAFNSTTVSLGDSGSATRFLNAVQINENGTEVINTTPGATEDYVYTAADQLVLTINSMAAKSISDLDVGRFYIELEIYEPNNKLTEIAFTPA